MMASFLREIASPVVLLLLLTGTSAIGLEVGDRAPTFATSALDGGSSIELDQYRGRVVYLDFWASWCAPCLVAIPEAEKMRIDFLNEEFQILAINLDQNKKKALRFLSKHPVGYPVGSDPKGRLPSQYGVDTMPTSYLIDRNGMIRYVHRGFQRGDGSMLQRKIRKLLEEK